MRQAARAKFWRSEDTIYRILGFLAGAYALTWRENLTHGQFALVVAWLVFHVLAIILFSFVQPVYARQVVLRHPDVPIWRSMLKDEAGRAEVRTAAVREELKQIFGLGEKGLDSAIEALKMTK